MFGPAALRDFRMAAVVAGLVPLVLVARGDTRLDFSEAVALVFAVAASTFCPLLVLGIWWRGLTAAGRDRGGRWSGGLPSAGAVAVSLAGCGGHGLARRAALPARDRQRARPRSWRWSW